jgi:hypothetical protein
MLEERFQIGLERGDEPKFAAHYRDLLAKAVEESLES